MSPMICFGSCLWSRHFFRKFPFFIGKNNLSDLIRIMTRSVLSQHQSRVNRYIIYFEIQKSKSINPLYKTNHKSWNNSNLKIVKFVCEKTNIFNLFAWARRAPATSPEPFLNIFDTLLNWIWLRFICFINCHRLYIVVWTSSFYWSLWKLRCKNWW